MRLPARISEPVRLHLIAPRQAQQAAEARFQEALNLVCATLDVAEVTIDLATGKSIPPWSGGAPAMTHPRWLRRMRRRGD